MTLTSKPKTSSKENYRPIFLMIQKSSTKYEQAEFNGILK